MKALEALETFLKGTFPRNKPLTERLEQGIFNWGSSQINPIPATRKPFGNSHWAEVFQLANLERNPYLRQFHFRPRKRGIFSTTKGFFNNFPWNKIFPRKALGVFKGGFWRGHHGESGGTHSKNLREFNRNRFRQTLGSSKEPFQTINPLILWKNLGHELLRRSWAKERRFLLGIPAEEALIPKNNWFGTTQKGSGVGRTLKRNW